jgi:hypothetical protein
MPPKKVKLAVLDRYSSTAYGVRLPTFHFCGSSDTGSLRTESGDLGSPTQLAFSLTMYYNCKKANILQDILHFDFGVTNSLVVEMGPYYIPHT